ncbi:MAG TPA: pseudouridine-5'-phosphate glycosidase [Dongiaceae bacterium]|nr:pseudouridine-5'-phosphate glycosidase [Dongiaceae bacterium]
MHPDLDVAPEITAALRDRRGIVALESTIIAHGMPYPDNLDVARRLEGIIRLGGAVPATIAILDGRLKVGLSEAELEHLAQSRDIAKASVRDLPVLLATRRDGATTVASTMRVAAMAGIRIFATGGIGGVHRGAELTGDISADLTEFARSPVAVVSAGAKAILDLPRTLEMLETLSVPVIGYGCDEFPSFYSRSSGLRLQARADTAEELARVLTARWRLDEQGGVLVANPIPAADEIPAAVIEGKIRDALSQAQKGGVTGKEVTPYLLSRIRILTEGASQRANVALVLNNARLAADIAVALAANQEG